MINLEGLVKELKSNKEIEFERLEKEFINDNVILEVENCEKSFIEEYYVAMAGQKFVGQYWEDGEDWKYTIEDFPSVAKALAQNEHTNKDTILYILLFARDLEKDKDTKLLAYEIQDLAFANPIFPDLRYELMADGADFYESAAGSLDLLPAMLKNPNYPSDGLLMVLNKIESIDNKTEKIIRTVVKHKNFLIKHLVKDEKGSEINISPDTHHKETRVLEFANSQKAIHLSNIWKFIILEYKNAASALAQNAFSNEEILLDLYDYAKSLKEHSYTSYNGEKIEDLIFNHPLFPSLRTKILKDGQDFYEAISEDRFLLLRVLGNSNYPLDGLIMVLEKIKNIDDKNIRIINSVLRNENFNIPPSDIKNNISREYIEQYYVDGEYLVVKKNKILKLSDEQKSNLESMLKLLKNSENNIFIEVYNEGLWDGFASVSYLKGEHFISYNRKFEYYSQNLELVDVGLENDFRESKIMQKIIIETIEDDDLNIFFEKLNLLKDVDGQFDPDYLLEFNLIDSGSFNIDDEFESHSMDEDELPEDILDDFDEIDINLLEDNGWDFEKGEEEFDSQEMDISSVTIIINEKRFSFEL